MGLTSGWLIGLAGFLAATAFAGTLLVWRRVATPRVSHALARIGLLLWAQVTVMLVIFLSMNRSFGFFASWADLFGTGQTNGVIVTPHGLGGQAAPAQSLATGALTAQVGNGSPAAFPGSGDPARHGLLQLVRITGVRSGISPTAYVYLPPQYFRGFRGVAPPGQQGGGLPGAGAAGQPFGMAGRTLPVVVVISGHVAAVGDPYSAASVAATAAGEIEAGRATPAIYVMLTPAVAGERDRACLDVPGGPQAATFFSQDLPAAIQSAYPASQVASGWAVMGDATGGYCALWLAIAHSDRFAVAAAPLGGYGLPPGASGPGSAGWWLSGGSARIREESDLIWRLRHRPPQPISVLFTRAGPASQAAAAARPFLSLAKPPMQVTEVTLAAGPWPLSPVVDRVAVALTPERRP